SNVCRARSADHDVAVGRCAHACAVDEDANLIRWRVVYVQRSRDATDGHAGGQRPVVVHHQQHIRPWCGDGWECVAEGTRQRDAAARQLGGLLPQCHDGYALPSVKLKVSMLNGWPATNASDSRLISAPLVPTVNCATAVVPSALYSLA